MRKIKQKRFKEVKQYGLGGDFGPEEYDAFYDDNEIFKAIYNKVKKFDSFLNDDKYAGYKDAKDLAEAIFDYVIDNYREIPKKEKLDIFIDTIFEEDTKFFKEIMKPLLTEIPTYIDSYADNSIEYHKESLNDMMLDYFYDSFNNFLDISDSDVPKEVDDFFEKNNINTDDIPEVLENVIKTYIKYIDFYIYDDSMHYSDIIKVGGHYISTEVVDELPENLYFVDELPEEYIEYIETNCNNYVDLRNGNISIPISQDYDVVCYFDDIKEYILEYAQENDLIEE